MINHYRKGVGAFLINQQKQVFIAKRITPANAWQMPQGGLDDNENHETAILRELNEEIGTNNVKILGKTKTLKYDLPVSSAQKFFNGKYCGQEQIWFAMLFLGDDNEINLNASNHPEFCEWRWEDPKNLVDIIVDFKKQLYADILKEMLDLKIIN